MGGVESRFNTLLVEGRAEEALQLWNENLELQAKHHPNNQIKTSPQRDTPLHCTTRHEMRDLMHEFLTRGADPLATNGLGETSLHIVCRAAKFSSRRAKRRAELLQMMLDRIPGEEGYDVIRGASSLERRGHGLTGFGEKEQERRRMMMNGASAAAVMVTTDDDAHHLGTQDKVS